MGKRRGVIFNYVRVLHSYNESVKLGDRRVFDMRVCVRVKGALTGPFVVLYNA